MASGSQNMTTYIAKRIIGDSTNVNWAGALLHSGTGGKTSAMDTWIFADDYGNASSTYGILHHQSDDKIVFVGASADRFWNNLNTGDTYIDGKLGIEYNPETSGNTYKLYVNGTSYLNGELSVIGTILEKNGSICIDNTTTDLTASNNGSSSTIYHSIWGRDKANRSWFCVEGYTNANGSVAAFLGVRNYNTDGTAQSWKGITITEAKDNTLAYTVSDPAKFITAIMGDSDSSKFYRGDKTWANTLHNVFYIHRDTADWKTGAQLQFNVTKDNTNGYSYIAAYQTPTATTYNQSLVIVATGSCFIGGGEGAETIHQFRADSSGTEDLFLCPDGSIRIYTGADAKTQRAVIDSTPSFYPATTNTGNLGTSSYRWATLYSGTGNFTGDVTVAAGKRVGASGGALYLGNSGNQNWVYVQDMCSQDGQKWKIHQSGAAEFSGTVTAPTFSGNATSATYLKDRTNSTASYLNYGAAGLAASAITWLCCWNGYEVRAISKAEMANAVDGSHKWVRIDSDTITGVLHSSYKSGTWVNSLTNSVITLEDAAGSYGGWICGPTKNGRIAISTYQSSDDLLYIGYGERGRTTNSFTRSMTWNGANGRLTTASVANAVWNDIAESRVSDIQTPGYVIAPGEDKIAHITTKRLQSAGRIISDTYGYLLGDEDNEHAPVAIAGRVLAYPLHDKSYYEVGDAVCAAEGGKIDKMTRDEIKEYPDRIIGIVNEIPDYDIWEPSREGGGREPIHTNGRIWIDVK